MKKRKILSTISAFILGTLNILSEIGAMQRFRGQSFDELPFPRGVVAREGRLVMLSNGTGDDGSRRSVFPCAPMRFLVLPANVEMLQSYCFLRRLSLTFIAFEADSRLRGIEAYAFSYSALRFLAVPSGVERLGRHCFARCYYLELVTFENSSRLQKIEAGAFYGSLHARVILPNRMCFSAKELESGWPLPRPLDEGAPTPPSTG
ncbi:MAG: leucine-rich repeat domain-containing protein [Holosporales bacterium]|jgi:hypothetical protein|nr:leucine-rich repeat domain-containing protein [Holosporales bacterium]